MSPSIWMNVLFLANTNVFSWPVSANVSSGPRCSKGTGLESEASLPYTGSAVLDDNCCVDSVVLGSLVVERRKGGNVSTK